MQKEYNFSNAERSKFYRKDARLELPIYLDADNYKYVQNIAKKKKSDLNKVVNDLIKTSIAKQQALK